MMKRGAQIMALLTVAGNSGCVMSLSSFSNTSGSTVSPAILIQITDGETTKDWLIDHLGQPTVTEDRGDGMEDLTYEAVTRVVEHFSVLLLLSSESSVERAEQWVFELKNGIVHRHHRNMVVRAIDD
jgi:hypothetical protein